MSSFSYLPAKPVHNTYRCFQKHQVCNSAAVTFNTSRLLGAKVITRLMWNLCLPLSRWNTTESNSINSCALNISESPPSVFNWNTTSNGFTSPCIIATAKVRAVVVGRQEWLAFHYQIILEIKFGTCTEVTNVRQSQQNACWKCPNSETNTKSWFCLIRIAHSFRWRFPGLFFALSLKSHWYANHEFDESSHSYSRVVSVRYSRPFYTSLHVFFVQNWRNETSSNTSRQFTQVRWNWHA